MMYAMETKKIINKTILSLLEVDSLSYTKRWQSVEIENSMKELTNLFFTMEVCNSLEDLADQTFADLPWAEDHFKERISGATNPGKEYLNWPYYRPDLDDNRFRKDGKFSHTYQERFWPTKTKGIRYEMGDWEDVVSRFVNDVTTRQCFLSIWHPEDQSNNGVRLPCTIGYWFKLVGDKVDLTYLIRSCDARRHFRNDIYMAQRLLMEMGNHLQKNDLNLELGSLHVWIGSFHCFESDVYTLKRTLKQCADFQ